MFEFHLHFQVAVRVANFKFAKIQKNAQKIPEMEIFLGMSCISCQFKKRTFIHNFLQSDGITKKKSHNQSVSIFLKMKIISKKN